MNTKRRVCSCNVTMTSSQCLLHCERENFLHFPKKEASFPLTRCHLATISSYKRLLRFSKISMTSDLRDSLYFLLSTLSRANEHWQNIRQEGKTDKWSTQKNIDKMRIRPIREPHNYTPSVRTINIIAAVCGKFK